jgi:hypothetical protein
LAVYDYIYTSQKPLNNNIFERRISNAVSAANVIESFEQLAPEVFKDAEERISYEKTIEELKTPN